MLAVNVQQIVVLDLRLLPEGIENCVVLGTNRLPLEALRIVFELDHEVDVRRCLGVLGLEKAKRLFCRYVHVEDQVGNYD